MSKQDKHFVLTPEGQAEYPYLLQADTKYKPEGEYKVTLKLDYSKDAETLYKTVSMVAQQAYDTASTKAANAGKRQPKRAELPVYDSGKGYVLKAKLRASGTVKATGKPFTQAPRIFDADNKLWDKTVAITNGSTLRLCCEIVPFDSPALGVGVTLRLKDVQVIELGNGMADNSPFGAVSKPQPAFGVPSGEDGGYDDGDF